MRRSALLLLLLPTLGAVVTAETAMESRQRMVREQILAKGIVDPRILAAFNRVARHLFVAPLHREQAYADVELPIDEGQTVNRPYTVAIMTAAIAPDERKKVLEIGTGSGYQAAILAELVKQVYTIDIYERLTQKARERIRSLGYDNVFFKTGDGFLGWAEHAPYEGIIVTCSPDHIPEPLIRQLAVGGRMVIPVSFSRQVQELILIEKEADGRLKRTNLIPVKFVPMIQRRHAD
ncbi:MAG: protein-L-isoaspartate(D-aspartate) O-methyltransferase [Acidobacteriota bacterium]|jgi:protein-L-isoaspartate(D-aspartate) O-methyltransferase|nr:protein-L-isoaspartate(D-aspartate) O-methyltransferase [Acidobacteriota bacterium]